MLLLCVIVALREGEGVVVLLENLMAAVRWTMGGDVGRWAVDIVAGAR